MSGEHRCLWIFDSPGDSRKRILSLISVDCSCDSINILMAVTRDVSIRVGGFYWANLCSPHPLFSLSIHLLTARPRLLDIALVLIMHALTGLDEVRVAGGHEISVVKTYCCDFAA